MKELFSVSEAKKVRKPLLMIPNCGRCGLHERCQSPKIPFGGKGLRKILLVSEYPGKYEDQQGKFLVGPMGRFLEDELARFSIDMWRDCWVTNALICHDVDKVYAGEGKWKSAVEDCRPNLLRTIERTNPEVIILLGTAAVESLIGHLWKESPGAISRWTGYKIPNHSPNCWICPTNNPAYVMRQMDRDPVVLSDFRSHLRAAVKLQGRPWSEGPPDYQRDVIVELDANKAAQWLSTIRDGKIAFDLETDRLKSQHPEAEIVCASVYHRDECWAFPWHGPVIGEMRRILEDHQILKIGYNQKFEHLWIHSKLGIDIKGWGHDGMLVAHAIDPRRGVTGLKFQAFVQYGQPDYDGHVKPFLSGEEEGGNSKNRIREVGMAEICRYCGTDSILEWNVAHRQSDILGLDL